MTGRKELSPMMTSAATTAACHPMTSALTLCGPVATGAEIRGKIAAALSALCLLATSRSATLAGTGHSTFQPTAADPAVGIVIDEADQVVVHVPGAGPMLELLASRQRTFAVFLIEAAERAVIKALGGAVRASMSDILAGTVARDGESRHATGGAREIPDIRDYAKGAPGYFQDFDPRTGEVTGRGRSFLLGKPPAELACMKRIVEARRHLRDWSIPELPAGPP